MVVRRSSGSRPSSLNSESAPKVVIPKLIVDPIWSLQPWPLVVRLGGEDLEIPAMTAVEWLAYLMQPQPDIDGMILDLLPEGEELLYEEKISVEELYEAILDIITTVCARPWWVALRQIGVAQGSWHILGPQMLESIDITRVSISGWLDVLLVKTIASMEPKDVAMFTARLEAPPVGVESAPMEEMEMDRSTFLSMQ